MTEYKQEYEPLVTFVILNWNQCEMTLDCLRSLNNLEYKNYNVIVVDNGSSDNSAEEISNAYPNYEVVINQGNLGYSEGNNVGIRRALESDTEYIFLLNNDTYVDPKMLARLVSVAQQDPKVGITGPTMLYADPPNRLWGGKNWVDWHRTQIVREQMGELADLVSLESQGPVNVMYIDSCAILVRSKVFEEIGLLDNRFFINFDDVDLCLRASKAGYKIIYDPSALIWHRVSAAIGVGSPANTYYMTRNALIFFTQHSPGLSKITSIFRLFFDTLRTIIAWKLNPSYRTDIYQRKGKANILALRDFILKRSGQMGPDVIRVCYS